jgi:hypothetical protein
MEREIERERERGTPPSLRAYPCGEKKKDAV